MGVKLKVVEVVVMKGVSDKAQSGHDQTSVVLR